jgi:hypothetical protein
MSSAQFQRYIGIHFSGAETASSSLKGLRIYMTTIDDEAKEVAPPPSPRRYWTRKEVAHWLLELLRAPTPTVVGISHGFSFPIRYFEAHQIPPDWDVFLRDFQSHWPTDGPYQAAGILVCLPTAKKNDRPERATSDFLGFGKG